MAQNSPFRRYLEAGMQFTQMTQRRAEGIVRDLVRAGEVQAEQAQAAVAELVERSRKNSDRLVDQIRREIKAQLSNLGVATQDDISRLERKIASSASKATSTTRKAVEKTTSTAKKTASTARKAAAKKR